MIDPCFKSNPFLLFCAAGCVYRPESFTFASEPDFRIWCGSLRRVLVVVGDAVVVVVSVVARSEGIE